jgi:RNA polymerase sigma-70 factor, ECF subfamily
MRRKHEPIANERDLVARSREGDKDAYRELVLGYQDRVFRLILAMVRRPEVAEDLTQEVFVKAYFALASFEGGSALYTWLFRIATNHTLDHLRKRQPAEVSLDTSPVEDEDRTPLAHLEAPAGEDPEAMGDHPSEAGALLATLTPDQRTILSLRELEGYSYEELAAVLHCGVNTVKSRLNRAREALKTAYRRFYGTSPTTLPSKTVEEA